MAPPPHNTDPAAERFIVHLRLMPAWRKLEMVARMNQACDILSLSGLRRRYPQATEAELRRRFADIRLGPELARRVYGPLDASEPSPM